MFGVDSILANSSSSNTEDYYQILGCSETSTLDQITTEYKVRALKCHPDKNKGNDSALAEFQKLQEARDILVDPEKRCNYDHWKQSGICMPYKQWLGLSSRCQMTMHWSTPKTGLMLEEDQNINANDSAAAGATTEENCTAKESVISEVKTTKPPWKSENSSGIYGKFRNYQI